MDGYWAHKKSHWADKWASAHRLPTHVLDSCVDWKSKSLKYNQLHFFVFQQYQMLRELQTSSNRSPAQDSKAGNSNNTNSNSNIINNNNNNTSMVNPSTVSSKSNIRIPRSEIPSASKGPPGREVVILLVGPIEGGYSNVQGGSRLSLDNAYLSK